MGVGCATCTGMTGACGAAIGGTAIVLATTAAVVGFLGFIVSEISKS